MTGRAMDPFLVDVGKFLGVPPEEIRLSHGKALGEFTCFGPRPRPMGQIPDLPDLRNYCFTFVLETPPPQALCNAYRQEFEQLRTQLTALIQEGAWDDVAAVAQRLSTLESAIERTCRVRQRAIRYCLFPSDVFEDPLVGGRTPPTEPPIPPLAQSR